jgi:hypothetical protein
MGGVEGQASVVLLEEGVLLVRMLNQGGHEEGKDQGEKKKALVQLTSLVVSS